MPALSFHDVMVPLDHMIGDVGEATALAELNNRKLSELYEIDGKLSWCSPDTPSARRDARRDHPMIEVLPASAC